MSIVIRSAKTVADATANLESVNSGNIVILGLTDNRFKTRDGKMILSYQLVVAELSDTDTVVRLVRMPFPSIRGNRGVLDVVNKVQKKNSGPIVDQVEKIIAENLDLHIEKIFDEKILPRLRKQILTVKPEWFRARSARGNECDRVVYHYDKVGRGFDLDAHIEEIETLLSVGNFCLYANDKVYNESAQIVGENEKKPEVSSQSPAQPTPSAKADDDKVEDVPF